MTNADRVMLIILDLSIAQANLAGNIIQDKDARDISITLNLCKRTIDRAMHEIKEWEKELEQV